MMDADLLVITSYPARNQTHGTGTVGIASYAKNTLRAIRDAKPRREKKLLKIVVLAEALRGTPDRSTYDENGIEVRRVWQRGSPFSYLSLLLHVRKFPDTKKILLEFEISMFGSPVSLVLFPIFLLFLWISGKRIYLVLHQYIEDINMLSGHIGWKERSLQSYSINVGIRWFYRLTFALVRRIIVFEEYFRQKAATLTKNEKIIVIPHGVEEYHGNGTKEGARKKLGLGNNEFVLLYFGFIAWYKGTDWIVNQVQSSKLKVENNNIKLIIAGGANPNHREKTYYMEYVKKIEEIAKESNGRIVVTGFVDEKDIPVYFQACDAVVLPYRVMMSSSGPLSLAFTYHKPIVLSEPLGKYAQTRDFQDALDEVGLKDDEVFFRLDTASWDSMLQHMNEDKVAKLVRFSALMEERRRFEEIRKQYFSLIFYEKP